MSTLPKSRFWEARTTVGRPRLFESPEALWAACCEYFQWVEDNPLYEVKAFAYQGEVVQEAIPKMRAMTIDGICLFLDISRTSWYTWAAEPEFSYIIAKAENIIRSQKFSGAAADLLNANIIARDLGLSDKSEIKQESTIKVSADMSPQDAAKAYQDLMNG